MNDSSRAFGHQLFVNLANLANHMEIPEVVEEMTRRLTPLFPLMLKASQKTKHSEPQATAQSNSNTLAVAQGREVLHMILS